MQIRTLILAAVSLLVGGSTFAEGLVKRPMSFDDIFKFSGVGGPRLSPDGSYVLFTETEADWEMNARLTHVWRVPTDGGEPVQLTRGDKSCTSPLWSPDGKIISFLSSRDEKTQLYFMYNDGGEAWKVTDHKSGVGSYEWSHDGAKIYFTAVDTLTEEEEKRREQKDDAYLYEKNEKNRHIWEFDVASKKERKITDGDFSVRTWRLSPDDTQIAFIAAPSSIRDADIHNEIYIVGLDSLGIRQLINNNAIERSLEWVPDGSALTFISDSNENLEPYYLESIFWLDMNGGQPRDLLPAFKWQVYSHFWGGKKKDTIYFVANVGVSTQLFSLNPTTRKWKRLTGYSGVIGGVHYVPDLGKIVCTRTSPIHPSDVYIADLDKLDFKQLTTINPLADSLSLAQYEVIHWPSYDGWTVKGILIKPPGYDPGRGYPLILQIHGGPESSSKLSFSTSWATYPHVLAGKGYVLLQPNYRGSTGYGDDCMRAIIGHYFERDWDDLMSGVDYLVNKGIVYPDSLAVMGWSAGGHLTNWTVTHSQRFKCASSGAGGANWYSFYAQTDMQYIREIWHDSSPYDSFQFWMKKSPIQYVKNASTPTLIFCGENDRRVPFPQSQEMYRGLKRNGCPVEFVVFPRSGHGPRELRHQMYKMKKEFAWFEHYVRGKEMPEDLDGIK